MADRADHESDFSRFNWPDPDPATERWRYVSITECSAALRSSAPSELDTVRFEARKGFVEQLAFVREELKSALGDLASLEKGELQAIDKLTKKAAAVWLEFSTQRCRIMFVAEGSTLRDKAPHEGRVHLVVSPSLVRIGNSKGLELDKEIVVGGCAGEVVEVEISS